MNPNPTQAAPEARMHAHPTPTSPGAKNSATVLPLRRESVDDAGSATLILAENGQVRDCSRAAAQLFGYPVDELRGRHASLLLPRLAGTELVQDGDLNPRLTFLSHCGLPFRASRRDGGEFACELFLNRLGNGAEGTLSVIVRAIDGPVLDCL